MTSKRSVVFGGLSVLAVMGIIASLVFALAANPDQESPPGVLNVDEAKARGLEHAQFAGLVGEPTSVVTELTNLEDYISTASMGSAQLGSDASSVGWNADRKIWVIAYRGHVKIAMPGSTGNTYDNLTIAIDAKTGELVGTDAYREGTTLPYR